MKRIIKSPKSTLTFDWLVTFLCAWFWGGIYYDIWYHTHAALQDLSLFSSAHYMFYTGFFATSVVLFITAYINFRKGHHWLYCLPAGYNLSVIGLGFFISGGLLDTIWHLAFGFENGIGALLSPPHLFIAIGVFFILSGPIRSAWNQPITKKNIFAQLPLLLCTIFILTIFTCLSQYSNPFVNPYASATIQMKTLFYKQAIGVGGILLYGIVLMCFILYHIARWKLVPGSMTIILTLNALLMSIMGKNELFTNVLFVVAAFIAGIISDILLATLKPDFFHRYRIYTFAFLVPIIFFFNYFISLFISSNVYWAIYVWTGVIFETGVCGILLSYLMYSTIPQTKKLKS